MLALAGCFFDDLDFRGTRFRCDDGVTCPAGFSCVAGYCATMDAPVVDAPPACGKIALFVDNFDNNVIDNPPWNDNAGSINEIGGAAVASISGSVPVSAYGSFERADLTASSVYVEVLQVTAETFLRVQSDDAHFLEIAVKNNSMSFKQDGTTFPNSIGYDGVAQRWWRISESGNTVSFDTSDNGTTWMSRATTPTPGYATSVTLQFGARTAQSTGEAHFENLNGGGPPSGPCGGG